MKIPEIEPSANHENPVYYSFSLQRIHPNTGSLGFSIQQHTYTRHIRHCIQDSPGLDLEKIERQ